MLPVIDKTPIKLPRQ